jgi:hypothetical protein
MVFLADFLEPVKEEKKGRCNSVPARLLLKNPSEWCRGFPLKIFFPYGANTQGGFSLDKIGPNF